MSIIELDKFLAGARGVAAVSQELWTSGGALVQRAQEPNIPFGESLTSILDLGVLELLSNSALLDLNVHIWWSQYE